MNPVIPVALILTLFAVALVVGLVLYFLEIWPFTNTMVFDPMNNEWVDIEDPNFDRSQLDPDNICEDPYCGGAWRSPQIEDIYQGTVTPANS